MVVPVPPTQVPQHTGILRWIPLPHHRVYVLELAGEDDDFAAAEAATAAEGVSVVAPGVATATDLDGERFVHLAFAHRASELVARTDGTIRAAIEALAKAPLDREGSVAVRARDVRATADVDTASAERRLGQVLVDAGYVVDLDAPDHVLVALFAGESLFLGWRVADTVREYGDRAPTDRPFFQPGSMDPQLARAVVNFAGVGPGDRLLDPMCGTGGLLVEAGLVGAAPVGFDAQRSMVTGARENLREFVGRDSEVGVADATSLPLTDGSVAAVVFDAPYGRQSKIAGHDLDALVAGALSEASRVADRAVLVSDRAVEATARAAGWSVEGLYERRVHRSLTRFVHVLSASVGPVD